MLALNSFFGILLLLTILTGNISTLLVPECNEHKLQTMYPLDDPNLYYFCLDKFTPSVLSCPPDTGFQYNEDAVGCVPWIYWNCTYKMGAPTCMSGSEKTFTRHMDPNIYYACAKTNTPLLVPCPDGSGYSYTKDMVGCVPWDMWDCKSQIV